MGIRFLDKLFSVSKYDFSDIIRDHPRCSSQLDRHITGLSLSKKKVIIFPKLKKKKNKRASKLQNQYTINLVSSERSKKVRFGHFLMIFFRAGSEMSTI